MIKNLAGKVIIYTIMFSLSHGLIGQEKLNCYWITFKNKDNSEFSTQRPWEFLGPRAILRRYDEGIPITDRDLPVSTQMKNAVNERVQKILYASRWLNAVNAVATEAQIRELTDLEYVQKIEYIGRYTKKKYFLRETSRNAPKEREVQLTSDPYGYGAEQITQVNGQYLHSLGFKGQGELIGVLDGGFTNVDIMPVFKSALEKERIRSSFDFIHGDTEVFESSTHGSGVLSMMASDLPGFYIGTAPLASFECMKTENTRGEYRLEEYNWIAGIERLDSLGGRITNASLGYTTFTDAKMNYSYEDLNGESSPASIAAKYAYERGILVFNSVGNSGNNPWKYMGIPSDSEYVFTVGGIDSEFDHAAFSSIGPTADGRIKPDLSVLGEAVTAPSVYEYDLTIGNGTSYSSPILTGLAASLWSAFPLMSSDEIKNALKESASNYHNPDPELGYGIPDLLKAYSILSKKKLDSPILKEASIHFLYNTREIQIFGPKHLLEKMSLNFFDIWSRETAPVLSESIDSYYAVKKLAFDNDMQKLIQIKYEGDIYYLCMH
jgi:hypothetical protein